jgi:hypothetical protein
MRKITLLIIAALALLTLAGCNRNAATPPPDGTSTPAEDLNPAPDTASPVHEALLSYKDYLEISGDLAMFLQETEESRKVLTSSRFALLDLEGDEVPELVVELADEYPYFYVVLHYEEGTLYKHVFSLREFNELKDDGTFSWSAGAGDSGTGKLRFYTSEYVIEYLAHTASSLEDDVVTLQYYIGGEPVTQERYDAFATEQSAKPAAPWLEYTQENINSALSPQA